MLKEIEYYGYLVSDEGKVFSKDGSELKYYFNWLNN
jgi:hypothetical protein